MQIYTGGLSDNITTSPILNNAYIGHPEFLERITKRICEQNSFYWTGMALGFGRYVTSSELTSNDQKLKIGNDNITWSVKPRFRQLVTVQTQINSGAGAGGATFNINLSNVNDQWVVPGMVLKYVFADTGAYILFLVQTAATVAGNWQLGVQIISSASTSVPENILANAQMGQTTIGGASCTNLTSYVPTRLLDIYRNWNTTMKPYHTICKTGIGTTTWFKSDDGQKCWIPTEQYDYEVDCLYSLELGVTYNESTVNSSGSIYVNDANGNPVMMGDGLLAQIASGNNVVYNINTYYQNPANYQTLLNQIQEIIENWSIAYGVRSNVTLFFHCGKKAFGLLQEVLKANADQSGGTSFISVFNYRKGEMTTGSDALQLSHTVERYRFSSFDCVLLNCAVFDDPAVHGTVQSGVSYSPPPIESFRFIVAPDTDCEGYPLIQLYFRGGCGLDSVWNNYYIAGTIDPTNMKSATPMGHAAANSYSGYSLGKEVEYNLVVRDNTKFVNFTGFQA